MKRVLSMLWCQCSILIKLQRNNQPSLGIEGLKNQQRATDISSLGPSTCKYCPILLIGNVKKCENFRGGEKLLSPPQEDAGGGARYVRHPLDPPLKYVDIYGLGDYLSVAKT